MVKVEVICESCDTQFIVLSKDESPSYCPFCSNPIDTDTEEEQ